MNIPISELSLCHLIRAKDQNRSPRSSLQVNRELFADSPRSVMLGVMNNAMKSIEALESIRPHSISVDVSGNKLIVTRKLPMLYGICLLLMSTIFAFGAYHFFAPAITLVIPIGTVGVFLFLYYTLGESSITYDSIDLKESVSPISVRPEKTIRRTEVTQLFVKERISHSGGESSKQPRYAVMVRTISGNEITLTRGITRLYEAVYIEKLLESVLEIEDDLDFDTNDSDHYF